MFLVNFVKFFVDNLHATACAPGDYHDINFNRPEVSIFPPRFLLEVVSDAIRIYFTPSKFGVTDVSRAIFVDSSSFTRVQW